MHSGALATAAGTGYLFLFLFMSGGIQVTEIPGVHFAAPKLVPVFFEAAAYTGPGLQVFTSDMIISVRYLVVLAGLLLTTLFSLNVKYILELLKLGLLRSCLVRGAGTGAAAFVSALASATYTCCGWAPSVALLGLSLSSALGLAPALMAAALLTLNAAILRGRLDSSRQGARRVRGRWSGKYS